MIITKIVDKYDSNKVWVIKRYSDRHVYFNQEICGKLFYSRFQKTTKKHIDEIFK